MTCIDFKDNCCKEYIPISLHSLADSKWAIYCTENIHAFLFLLQFSNPVKVKTVQANFKTPA